MKHQTDIISKLEQIGIVPVIQLQDTDSAAALGDALHAGGIDCAEVTFRAEGADKVIAAMVKAHPDMAVGAGTVLTKEQAKRAVDAGAKFLVAPGLNPGVVQYALDLKIPFVPGVSGASEIEQAMEMGLNHVKFFPAEQAGGLPYIRALSAPYPGMRFMPTGGVNQDNLPIYLQHKKIFACGGSWMVSPALLGACRWQEVTALCRQAVQAALGLEVAHVGINTQNQTDAQAVADLFAGAFGFSKKEGASSFFVSSGIEVMKSPYLGRTGHIALNTNSVSRALYHLSRRGFEAEQSTAKLGADGSVTAIYLKSDFGGFAVHLLQK